MGFLAWAVLPACFAGVAPAKGIAVRFLANPAEDSIVRYEVYRAGSPGGASVAVGEVAAVPGADTLSLPDLTAEKGTRYCYTILGVDVGGVVSEASEATQVAYPVLSLPDTLRPASGALSTTVTLAAASHPLEGSEPLSLALLDSSRFSVAYDPATRLAVFRSRTGSADSGWAVVRAEYFGKFRDRDSLYIVTASAAPVSLPPLAPEVRAAAPFPDRYSPRSQGPLSLRDLPGPGRLEILTLSGSRAFGTEVPRPGSALLWDGKDDAGRPLRPSRYVWMVRGGSGAVLGAGAFLLIP
jgi:hypothetical protein